MGQARIEMKFVSVRSSELSPAVGPVGLGGWQRNRKAADLAYLG